MGPIKRKSGGIKEVDAVQNWAKSFTYQARRLHAPRSVEEVRSLVQASPRLKVLGGGHSFSVVGDTTGDLVSLRHLNRVVELDPGRGSVTVEGGIRYGELAVYLHERGFALHNLASLPHITVAGACMTATHGSGKGLGNLATAVLSLEMVTADGELLTLSAEEPGDRFFGAVVSLGALGVVTRIRLRVEPAYQVSQAVYLDLPFETALDRLDELFAAGYSVSLFTDWRADRFHQVWLKKRTDEGRLPDRLLGARRSWEPVHPVPGHAAEACTDQSGEPGPWHQRLPHFRLEFTPSSGEELQSEYFVPAAAAAGALKALARLKDPIASALWVCEVRCIARDCFWLSPCYERDAVGIHFTWKKDEPAVRALLPEIEKVLEPYMARPHWGKLFSMPYERLQALYPRLCDFHDLAVQLDPGGKFRNAFVDAYVLGTSSGTAFHAGSGAPLDAS